MATAINCGRAGSMDVGNRAVVGKVIQMGMRGEGNLSEALLIPAFNNLVEIY